MNRSISIVVTLAIGTFAAYKLKEFLQLKSVNDDLRTCILEYVTLSKEEIVAETALYGQRNYNGPIESIKFAYNDSIIRETKSIDSTSLNNLENKFLSYYKKHELDTNFLSGINIYLDKRLSNSKTNLNLLKSLLNLHNYYIFSAGSFHGGGCWAGMVRANYCKIDNKSFVFLGYIENGHLFQISFGKRPPIWATSQQSIPIPSDFCDNELISIKVLKNDTENLSPVLIVNDY